MKSLCGKVHIAIFFHSSLIGVSGLGPLLLTTGAEAVKNAVKIPPAATFSTATTAARGRTFRRGCQLRIPHRSDRCGVRSGVTEENEI